MRLCVSIHACLPAYIHVRMCVCVCMYVCMYVCYVCDMCMYERMYVRTYVHSYVRTYMDHTHSKASGHPCFHYHSRPTPASPVQNCTHRTTSGHIRAMNNQRSSVYAEAAWENASAPGLAVRPFMLALAVLHGCPVTGHNNLYDIQTIRTVTQLPLRLRY